MATNKESTTQVKQFRGINRAEAGTVVPPAEFDTLQNIHVESASELKSIAGAQIIFSSFPGMKSILSTRFLTDAYGKQRLVVLGETASNTISVSPPASASDFNLGAGSSSVTFFVVYVGFGGKISSTKIQVNTANFSSPFPWTWNAAAAIAAAPEEVVSIELYYRSNALAASTGSPNFMAGMVARKNGVWPALTFVEIPNRNLLFPVSTTSQIVVFEGSTFLTAPPDTELQPGKRFFFGMAPFAATQSLLSDFGTNPRVFYQDTSGRPLVYTPSKAGTSVSIAARLNTGTNAGAIPFFWAFAGVTPEDMSLIWQGPTSNRVQVPGALTEFLTATNTDIASNTINRPLPGEWLGGSLNVFLTSGTIPTGLTSGQQYFVVNQTPTSFQLALTSGGAPITITPAGACVLSIRSVSAPFEVIDIPTNTRQCVHTVQSVSANQGGTGQDAPSGRVSGIYPGYTFFEDGVVGATAEQIMARGGNPNSTTILSDGTIRSFLGAWVFSDLSDLTKRHQIIPHIKNYCYSLSLFDLELAGAGYAKSPYGQADKSLAVPGYSLYWWSPSSSVLSTDVSQNRLLMTNGDNVPFYTNGFVWKPMVRSAGGSYIPIAKYIRIVKDKVLLAGGDDNFANAKDQAFFSEIGNIFNFGTSPVWNSFRVNSGDNSNINGLGLFSINLSDTGPETFAIISKDAAIWTWNGLTGSSQVVAQVDQRTGFMSHEAWALTNFGTVFVGRDGNVYTFQGQRFVPIGDEIEDILAPLTDAQKDRVIARYSDNVFKISYDSTDGSPNDRELWLELRLEGGGLQKYYSGPHTKGPLVTMDTIGSFNGAPNVRVGANGLNLKRFDFGNSLLGAAIPVKIVMSRLGLEADHFWKVLTQIYMALKLAEDTTFTVQLESEDGVVLYTQTKAVAFGSVPRKLMQMQIGERFLGRINKVTISADVNQSLSIFDISLLSQVVRRRLIT